MTKTKILTATLTDVLIGLLMVEGLMDENSNFYIGVPQAADLFETSRNTAARDFKRILGEAFKTSDLKTEFNKNKTLGMSLSVFELLLNNLDRKGNIKARQLRDSLAGLSLHQLFCDAFRIKFEADERQEWLKIRMLTKETFWFMGTAIEAYYLWHPRVEKYPNQNYSEAFDALNLGLFGKRSRDIKKILDIGKNTLNHDHFGQESLKKIEMIQRIAEAQIDYQDFKPVEAVKFAVGIMNYQVSDFKE